jgi:hypothetical protein
MHATQTLVVLQRKDAPSGIKFSYPKGACAPQTHNGCLPAIRIATVAAKAQAAQVYAGLTVKQDEKAVVGG